MWYETYFLMYYQDFCPHNETFWRLDASPHCPAFTKLHFTLVKDILFINTEGVREEYEYSTFLRLFAGAALFYPCHLIAGGTAGHLGVDDIDASGRGIRGQAKFLRLRARNILWALRYVCWHQQTLSFTASTNHLYIFQELVSTFHVKVCLVWLSIKVKSKHMFMFKNRGEKKRVHIQVCENVQHL